MKMRGNPNPKEYELLMQLRHRKYEANEGTDTQITFNTMMRGIKYLIILMFMALIK